MARGGPAAHFRQLAKLADAVVLALAFPLAYFSKTELLPAEMTPLYAPETYFGPAAVVALGTLFFLERRGAYLSHTYFRIWPMLRAIGLAVGQALVLAATVLFVFKLGWVSRLFIGLFGLMSVVLLVGSRLLLRDLARRLRASGSGAARVVVVGDGPRAARLERALAEEAPFGVRIVAHVPIVALTRESGRVDVAGWMDEVLAREAIDEIAVASGPLTSEDLRTLVAVCEREGVALHVAVEALGPGLGRATFERMGDESVLCVNPQEHWAWGRAVKRAIDLVAAPVLIVSSAPLWAVAAIAIKLDSRGPVFFVQERIGLNKRRFAMVKFRTMVEGAEHMGAEVRDLNERDGPIFKVRSDPRVTRTGRMLRRFDIDELPQLLNVLLGQMSLIGPRPMLPSEITGFEPWQRKRFSMLPGITGLWQVHHRIDHTFLSGLQTDLDYIDRWSLWLDLRILLRTIPAIFRDRVAP